MNRLDDLLHKAGLKATPKRRLVADYFASSTEARTPEDVWRHLRRRQKVLGLPTVYRILEELTALGHLVRIDQADGIRRYAACRAEHPGHHHHIVCVRCGTVGVIPTCAFTRQMKSVERDSGFKVLNHRLHVEGLCPNCR